MTAINYPDCSATSPNRTFRAEAKSPANGAVPVRPGQPTNTHTMWGNSFQRDFRYQLIEVATGKLVWERYQADEASPHQLVVSDDGWLAIRTHGFSPEVLVLSPGADLRMRVSIVRTDEDSSEPSELDRGNSKAEREVAWVARHMDWTTAGCYWAENSLPYFFRSDAGRFFIWRTYWGDRLVINLDENHIEVLTPDLEQVLDDFERMIVEETLDRLRPHEERIFQWLGHSYQERDACQLPCSDEMVLLIPVLHLAGVHRLSSSIPELRRWEAADVRSSSTSSLALTGHMVESQLLRPVITMSLQKLNAVPLGYPLNYFTRSFRSKRLDLPERVPDREQKLRSIGRDSSAMQVLELIGAPDHVRKHSRQIAPLKFLWSEEWEFDSLVGTQWLTHRITWEELPDLRPPLRARLETKFFGSKPTKVQMRSIDCAPSYWLESDRRMVEILRY